jgi:hypothetical protein
MRVAAPVLGSLLLSAGLLAGGCASPVSRVAGAAAPVTGSSSAVPTPAASPTRASSPDPAYEPTEGPAGSIPATPTAGASPVLGPDGLGKLRLGMTRSEATATGLIADWDVSGAGCVTTHLLAAAGKDPGNDGLIYNVNTYGVGIIDAYGKVSTPQGIRLGSSSAAMLRAYPDWRNVADPDAKSDGRGVAAVPGNSEAVYRIVTSKGKVVQLTLQVRDQDCYE